MAVTVEVGLPLQLPLCWRRKKGAVRSDPSVSVVMKKDDLALAPNPPPPPPLKKPNRSRVFSWRRKKSAIRTDPSAAKPPVVITISSDEDEDEDEEDRYPRIKKMRRVADRSVIHIPSDDPWPNPSSSSSRADPCCCSLTATANPSIIEEEKQTADSSAAEYAVDILGNLLSMECETKMKRWPLAEDNDQHTVLPIRAALVDRLVAVGERYGLHSDTLFLACSYFDRFLSSNALHPDELQLLSVSCMLLAIKYEEKRPCPVGVQDLCLLMDANGYCTKQQVLKMETRVVKSLNYQMASPTVKTFVNSFLATLDLDAVVEMTTHYLAELSLIDHGCNRFLPSLVAASAVFLSRFTLHPETHPWTSTLQRHTGYSPSDLKDCICAIHELQTNINCSTLMTIRNKYWIVAMLCPPPEFIHAAYFEGFTL